MAAILEIWADDSEENQENVPPRGKHTKPRVVKDRMDPLTLIAPDQAKRKYRLWPEVIYKLCDELVPFLERKTKRSSALPVIHQVLAALRFYTCGTYLEVGCVRQEKFPVTGGCPPPNPQKKKITLTDSK